MLPGNQGAGCLGNSPPEHLFPKQTASVSVSERECDVESEFYCLTVFVYGLFFLVHSNLFSVKYTHTNTHSTVQL